MNISSKEAAQREEFFKKSFRGTFSYNMKVSSVNSFLRSMAQSNLPSHLEGRQMEDHQAVTKKNHQPSGSSKDASLH